MRPHKKRTHQEGAICSPWVPSAKEAQMSNLGSRSILQAQPRCPRATLGCPSCPLSLPWDTLGRAGHKAPGQEVNPWEIPLEQPALCSLPQPSQIPGEPKGSPSPSSPSGKHQNLQEPDSREGLKHFSLSPFPGDIGGKKTRRRKKINGPRKEMGVTKARRG